MDASALWFTSPGEVERRTVEVPSPAEDEVVVETTISAISAGTELLLYRGEMPSDLAADDTLASLDGDLSYPCRYGYAAVGRVAETGTNVAADWDDERVFAFHPHQSRFVAPIDTIVDVPDGLSAEAAVLYPFMETAVTIVLDAEPRIHERVIVYGAGPIGLCCVFLLSQFPLATLRVIEPMAERRQLAREFGADEVGTPASDGGTFDAAIEVSGNPVALDEAIRTVGYDGRVIVGSWYGTKRAELDLGRRFHRDRVDVHSSQVSTIRPTLRGRWSHERRLSVVLQYLQDLPVEQLITHRIPFVEAEQAYDIVDTAPERAIQVLLTYQ